MKIVVAGAGYAGLACLMELRRRLPDAELHLYDPRDAHLKLTHLHETVRRPLHRYQVAFRELAARLDFRHHREALGFDLTPNGVTADGIDYDFLVATTGARPPALPRARDVYGRDELSQTDAGPIVDQFLAGEQRPRVATVVGGGASGIQFLFELADYLHERRQAVELRLIDSGTDLLPEQPPEIADYVRRKIEGRGVGYLAQTRYVGAGDGAITVEDSGGQRELPSGLTLIFPGVRPAPLTFEVDRYGRVQGSDTVFAAGDCAVYDSRGDDAMTAQIAVRQGKHVARNIDRLSRGIAPLEYFFRQLGYVVSLGLADAAGWVLHESRIVTGLPAFAIKEAIEAQYDLFVAGIDSYII